MAGIIGREFQRFTGARGGPAAAAQKLKGELRGIAGQPVNFERFGPLGTQLLQQALSPQGISQEALQGERTRQSEISAGARQAALGRLLSSATRSGFADSPGFGQAQAQIGAQSARGLGEQFRQIFLANELQRQQQQQFGLTGLGGLAGLDAQTQAALMQAIGAIGAPVQPSGLEQLLGVGQVAAPIIGGLLGGPPGAAAGQIAGSALGPAPKPARF